MLNYCVSLPGYNYFWVINFKRWYGIFRLFGFIRLEYSFFFFVCGNYWAMVYFNRVRFKGMWMLNDGFHWFRRKQLILVFHFG